MCGRDPNIIHAETVITHLPCNQHTKREEPSGNVPISTLYSILGIYLQNSPLANTVTQHSNVDIDSILR